ncbi:MAG: hypothetical protein IMZ70_00415 [Candidatus Atribacteria bacterium]|nr:hypothetical protein [Candidatus Atribacteria bacterium]MBE3140093.1 hypothetical protein [Thermoplasmata archaeon]
MEKDGGSAFPEICTDTSIGGDGTRINDTYSYGGMSLRDWFAGMVIQGLMANHAKELFKDIAEKKEDGLQYSATASYMIADALLKEKNKLTPSS